VGGLWGTNHEWMDEEMATTLETLAAKVREVTPDNWEQCPGLCSVGYYVSGEYCSTCGAQVY
jgi:hypothetical protein